MALRALAALGAGLLMAAPALAEDVPALMARAPALTLDGTVAPLTGAVRVGGQGWGPFRRLCVAGFVPRDDGGETPLAEPSCFNVEAAREEAGTWQLALRTDPIRGGPALAFTTSRDAAGVVGPVVVTVPAGVPEPPAAAKTRLETVFRAAVQAHGIGPATITPATPFLMPLPIGAVDSDMQVADGGFLCTPEGLAQRQGRAVLVAACRASAQGEIARGQGASITMAGRFALDLATGLVLQHGYAAYLVMEPSPRGGTRRMEMRTLSRQSLE